MLKHHELPSISSRKKKKKQGPLRSPLRDLNTSICSSSSSISIEAPKGCLRFFSPPSKSPNLLKPRFKSDPNVKPFSRSSKLTNERVSKASFQIGKKLNKNPPHLSRWQSVKKCYPKSAFKRMPSTCSMEVPKEMNGNFTEPVKDDESGEILEGIEEPNSDTDPVERSAFEPVFEHKLDKTVKEVATEKPNLKTASAQCSKEDLKKKQVIDDELGIHYVEKCTPVNKLYEIGRTVATSSSTIATKTTPPVQASVSPEINCASSSSVLAVSSAKTPACYGAGHIVSGVTDRRKCRARGILTVGPKDSSCSNLNIEGNENTLGDASKSRMSVPFPCEASMHWLLSPCEEMEENQTTNHNSSHRDSSDLCNVLESSSSASGKRESRSKITLLSPCRGTALEGVSGVSCGKRGDCSSSPSPTCERVVSIELNKNRYSLTVESSPFSSGSLGSGNVIRTPQSESSSDRHVDMSWLTTSEKKIYDFRYDIESATEDLLRASLSPKLILSEFVSPSDSADFSKPPDVWTNGSSFISNSMSGEMSPSLLRVSWRDGLSTRIFEMDESEVCRCLSDDENGADKSSSGKIKSSSSHELKNYMADSENCEKEIASLEFISHAPKCNGESGEQFHLKRSNPCEESICTDSDGLAVSGDSDWTWCYKNHMYEL